MTYHVRALEPSGFSKSMGYLSGLLMLGVLWLPFGHLFLGSAGGWMIFIGLLYIMPIYLIVCAAHGLLLRAISRRVGTKTAGPWGSVMVAIFLIVVMLYPAAVTDVGDAPDSYAPSAIQVLLDLDDAAAGSVQAAATVALFVTGVLLIAADIVDLVRLNRARARFNQVPPTYPAPAGGYTMQNGSPQAWSGKRPHDQLPSGSHAWQ